MAKHARTIRWTGWGLAVALMLALGACASEEKTLTAQDVRDNPSPDMVGMARTEEQRKNDASRTFNVNGRQIWDDIDMIMLWDRPSRLSPYPVP